MNGRVNRSRAMMLATALAVTTSVLTTGALAQSYGLGRGFGDPYFRGPPGYDGPWPGYYGRPVLPPPDYQGGGQPILQILSPDAVFDALEDAGYSEFGPMAPRGNRYTLTAVNPRGDVVALAISVFTGEIERERVLERGRRSVERTLPPSPPPRTAPSAPPAAADGRDPLVVY